MVNAAAPTQATVVIGGGFGGISAIQALRHRHPEIPVILVEPRERFVFQPLLYELLILRPSVPTTTSAFGM